MRQFLGYILGFAIFIAGIPLCMWWVSGMPSLCEIPVLRLILGVIVALAGLAVSVWSIVHMKRVGKGNPFDAMGHEVAPRTKHLMTDGPYRYSRNPMLSEEKRLEADFGGEYADYKKKTGRFITFKR